MGLVEIKNVTRVFGKTNALLNANLIIEREREYAIVGASGSGKSTLLHLIGGLDKPTTGEILVEGRNLLELKDDEMAAYRNRYIGFVFQFHYLLPSMNVIDNILLPLRIGGIPIQTKMEKINQIAERLSLTDKFNRFPYELAGGEQQRVAILRALSMEPQILLCDEPTGNLDSINAAKVIELMRQESRNNHSTLIIVTHDQKIAGTFEQKIELRDGKII